MDHTHRFKLGSRSADVLKELTRLAASPEYAQGGRLPNELELCRRFKVSRTTVRKAISCMVEDGRVVVRRRAGAFLLGPDEMVRRQAGAFTVAIMGYLDSKRLARLQEQALLAGHLISVYSQEEAHWNSSLERKFLERVRAAQHRGIIAFLSPREPRNDALVSELDAAGIRVVHVEYFNTTRPHESYRLCDYQQAGRMAAVEFLMAGYERVAMIRTTDAPYEAILEEGFAAALREHGSGHQPETNRVDVRWRHGNPTSGVERLRIALRGRKKPMALFCSNDLILNDLMEFARQSGWKIPNDLGVLVFQFGETPYHPSVDSLVYDRDRDYREALSAILAPTWEKQQVLQPVTLVRRGSLRGRPVRPLFPAKSGKHEIRISKSETDRK